MFNNEENTGELMQQSGNVELITSPIEQVRKMDGLSNRYGFISTKEILNTLNNKGWNVAKEQYGRSKNKGFQKHILRLQNEQFPAVTLRDNHTVIPEVVIMNSHDGSTAFRMFVGFLRVACLNGLIAGNGIGNFRVIHSNNFIKNLQDRLDELVLSIPKGLELAQQMSQVMLSQEEIDAYNKLMVDKRLEKVDNIIHVNENCFGPLRVEDKSNDLFTVYNRAQERLINGGIKYTTCRVLEHVPGYGIEKNHTTRRISSTAQSVSLNQFAWNEAIKLLDKAG